jgi:hypothetical protein
MEEYGEKCNKTFEISNDSAALMADNVVSKFGMASAAVGGLAATLGVVSKILEETGHQEGAKVF